MFKLTKVFDYSLFGFSPKTKFNLNTKCCFFFMIINNLCFVCLIVSLFIVKFEIFGLKDKLDKGHLILFVVGKKGKCCC